MPATKKKVSEHHHSIVECRHISEFDTSDRIREDPGNISEFAAQLKDEGQQNPITYEVLENGTLRLNTGFRRFAAAGILASKEEFIGMNLPEGNPRRVKGTGYVLCRDIGSLSELERLTLEFSENAARKQFNDAEEAIGIARLKKLLEADSGKKITVMELSRVVNRSIAHVGMGLKVADAVDRSGGTDTELGKKLMRKSSVKAAYDTLRTTEKIKEIKDRLSKSRVIPGEQLEAIDFSNGLEFLKKLPNQSVDFFNFDPPWGIGVDEYDRHHKHENFDDSPEYAWTEVIELMVPELYRVSKPDVWGVVWFGMQFYERMKTLLEKHGFIVDPVPCIWVKDNKKGSQNDPDRIEMNVYESYLRVRKGDPRLYKKPVTNVLILPMDLGDSRTHFAQKPVAVMQEILERYSFGNMFCVDPTYGSGTFFKACQKLGRVFAGAEKNENNRNKAKELLQRVD